MFKLKPQKNSQDGSFLLVIECGTESSSMSIKVPLGSAWPRRGAFVAARILALGPYANLSGTVASLVLCCMASGRYSRVELGLAGLWSWSRRSS